MFNSMAPAFSTASRFAGENGTPYSILLTTTPSSLDLEEGQFFHNTVMGQAAVFDERYYDWYFEKGIDWLTDFVNNNSQNDFVYIKYSYKQLGKDEKWFQSQVRLLNGNMALVKREILLEWTHSSDSSLLDEDTLENIAGYADRDYEATLLINDKHVLNLTRHPSNMLRKNYLIGLDIAGGLGRDKTALTIIDPLDYSIVGILQNNNISAVDLVDIVVEIVTRYFPSAIIVPELNHTGEVFVELMLKNHPRLEKNMFYVLKERRVEKVVQTNQRLDFGPPKRQTSKKEVRKYGITTTSKSRDIMINEILFNFITDRPEIFNNRDIFNELRMLERKKNGKIEHSDNGHDDILFSYLVAIYALLYEQSSMKRFLKVIVDDENYINENPEDKEKRERKSSNLKGYSNLINDGGSLGELGNKFYEDGILNEKKSINDKDNVKNNMSSFRNLFN